MSLIVELTLQRDSDRVLMLAGDSLVAEGIAVGTDRFAEPPEPVVEHVVMSWEIGRDGRKREAGSAIYDAADGSVLAVGRALWIELKPVVPGG